MGANQYENIQLETLSSPGMGDARSVGSSQFRFSRTELNGSVNYIGRNAAMGFSGEAQIGSLVESQVQMSVLNNAITPLNRIVLIDVSQSPANGVPDRGRIACPQSSSAQQLVARYQQCLNTSLTRSRQPQVKPPEYHPSTVEIAAFAVLGLAYLLTHPCMCSPTLSGDSCSFDYQ